MIHLTSFAKADLREAHLGGAQLMGADLSGANLQGAVLVDASLGPARVVHAKNLKIQPGGSTVDELARPEYPTNLQGANLSGADMRNACLVDANLEGADLRYAHVFGTSVWNVRLNGALQTDLVVTKPDEPALTADGLEVAQFMYLMLNNAKLRAVIDTITSKVVLILGRFSAERKRVLDLVRRLLRERGYVPVMFDFEEPQSRNSTETVELLARMSRFVIADASDPRCVPHEISRLDTLRSVPIKTLIEKGQVAYAMLKDFASCPHFLPVCEYSDEKHLQEVFETEIISQAEERATQLRRIREAAD
jgi:hypothetical protein